jgi:multiple sugar transport system substrate-binding protein
VAAVGVLAATACGGSDDSGGSGGSAGAGGSGDEPVTLTFWSWVAGSKDAVEEFNRTHDTIQVKYTEIVAGADGYAKISNSVEAGNAPDVAGIEYGMVPEFASQGLLEDLTDQVGELVAEEFPEGLGDLVSPGGRFWTVPADATPQLLYYRTDLFDQAGVDVPATWEEFARAAEEIKDHDGGVRILNIPQTADPFHVTSLAWQGGSRGFGTEGDAWTVNINDEAAQRVAGYWDGLVTEDLVHHYPAWSEEETMAVAQGASAAFIGAPWSGAGMLAKWPDLAGKWAVAPLPSWDGQPAAGMWGGTSYGVPRGSDKTEAATEFIEWLTTDPAAVKARLQKAESPSSALPGHPEQQRVAAAEWAELSDGYLGNDLYEVAGQAARSVVPGWTWGPVQGSVNEKWDDVSGKDGFAAAFAAAQQEAEKALQARGLEIAK